MNPKYFWCCITTRQCMNKQDPNTDKISHVNFCCCYIPTSLILSLSLEIWLEHDIELSILSIVDEENHSICVICNHNCIPLICTNQSCLYNQMISIISGMVNITTTFLQAFAYHVDKLFLIEYYVCLTISLLFCLLSHCLIKVQSSSMSSLLCWVNHYSHQTLNCSSISFLHILDIHTQNPVSSRPFH